MPLSGCASESNNNVLKGVFFDIINAPGSTRKQIITSQIEHPSVREVCKFLETKGAEVIYLPGTQDLNIVG